LFLFKVRLSRHLYIRYFNRSMKKKLVNSMLVLCGLLVSIALCEIVLRIIGYSNPLFYTFDSELGTTLNPDAEGWHSREGKAYIKINSDGLRDIEHSIRKLENTYRIAVLGDSYMEGLQLPLDKLSWKIMEADLNLRTLSPDIKEVEVINFGVSGYGTARELIMLNKKVWKYKPDLVILMILTGNDIRDNSKKLNGIDYIPYFYLNDKGRLILDDSFLTSPDYKANRGFLAHLLFTQVNNVRLLQLFNDIRRAYKLKDRNKDSTKAGSVNEELGLDNMLVFKPPVTKEWKDAWNVTEALIRKMHESVTANNAKFMVVTLSNGIQVHPDPDIRLHFKKRLGVDELDYPDKRINILTKKHAIPYLGLAPTLQQWAQEHETCVHGFENSRHCRGHWNEHGHRLAGKHTALFISETFFDMR